MRLVNIVFKDKTQLENEFKKSGIKPGGQEKYFVQIFGPLGREMSEYLIDTINAILPGCEILLASSSFQLLKTDAVSEICLCVSCFSHSEVRTSYISSQVSEKEMAKQIVSELVTPRTKLLVIFIEFFSVLGEELLDELYVLAPKLIVSGGRAAANNMKATRTLIGNTKGVYTEGIVCAAIDSDVLNVQNSYVFGWKTIGLSLEVTKSDKNIIYEINNTPIKEIYRHYLGEDVFRELKDIGWNFPLVFQDEQGNLIARVMADILEDGISFLGNIPEGSIVKFAYGLLENVKRELLIENSHRPKNTEAIYMYSCVGRIEFLGLNGVGELLSVFMDTDKICGFFTYGEIYHFEHSNSLMNLSNTRIMLSEKPFEFESTKCVTQTVWTKESKILNAITHLSGVTSSELDVATKSLRSYRDLVIESTQHVETDKNLNITFVNDKMARISGYKKEELVGRNALDFLDQGMVHTTLNEIIPTLQEKGVWVGKMSHIKADGSIYYVNAFIKAIFDRKGEVSSYIVGEIDRTDEEMRNRKLESDVKFLKYSEEEKMHFLRQYEDIIDNSQILFRLDLNRNFVYANSTFLEVSGFKPDEIIGKNIYDFLDENQKRQFLEIHKALETKGIYRGVIEHNRSDGAHFYINSVGVFIRDLSGKPIEIMAVGTDITKIIEVQKEIEDVQKDVIVAMGTICEGRSRETGNHIKRVAEYSKLLAKLYGCTPQEQELIYIASPMHDIGKIAIPDSVLNKPGKLTPEEFEIMKTHTTLGADMLQSSNRIILQTASQIARSHHEWWSGEGYPNKLKGEEIPIFGRITALVDVFDAVSNDRVYKKAWPLPEVIEYIKGLRNKQFQPELVDLFLDNIGKFLEISHRYKDV